MHRVGIIMNGVTGRMGANQHLMRSMVPIIVAGGLRAGDVTIMPDPILVGRNEAKLRDLARQSGIKKWSTDLDLALSDAGSTVYFDAQTTVRRFAAVEKALAAGKHVYCEKPVAASTDAALALYQAAEAAGVRHGVVQDKLWMPGLIKLKQLIASGFFGKILSLHGEFGYWVFEGDRQAPQRPSWNYRKEDGGGIILDMFPHWRYVLDNLFAPVTAVSCLAATHVAERWDENGRPYSCSADDAAYATFLLADGVVAQFNSAWTTRVRRDDLFTLQVDGSAGSAVAGLRRCLVQSYADTPRPVWNPDIDSPIDYHDQWREAGEPSGFTNPFRSQWELFLRHVVRDEPFPWNFLEGAKGLQLADLAYASWQERKWMDVPDLRQGAASGR